MRLVYERERERERERDRERQCVCVCACVRVELLASHTGRLSVPIYTLRIYHLVLYIMHHV